jgi:DNA-binding MarR family transcriptional regulator
VNTATDRSSDLAPTPAAVDTVDSSYLQTLVGYNARMAALTVIGDILPGMAPFGLRIVDFSILSIVFHNSGITSKQLCGVLNLLPPNLVGKIGALEKRGLLLRHPHPQDGRALGLQLTAEGRRLMQKAEMAVAALEGRATQALTASERRTLIRLLQKLYLP